MLFFSFNGCYLFLDWDQHAPLYKHLPDTQLSDFLIALLSTGLIVFSEHFQL